MKADLEKGGIQRAGVADGAGQRKITSCIPENKQYHPRLWINQQPSKIQIPAHLATPDKTPMCPPGI